MTNFHLIGIGGAGMSGLARILQAQGHKVTGSDAVSSPVLTRLRQEGFSIKVGTKLAPQAESVIYSSAIPPNHPERQAARCLKTFSYPEALGFITRGKRVVAVAGTHGKSTTTGLLVAGLQAAQVPFSCLVGTNLAELNGQNAQVAAADLFVLEACEYRRGFLNLTPAVLAITNVEADHLDYFQSCENYVAAFRDLVRRIPATGCLVADAKEENLAELRQLAPHYLDARQFKLELKLQLPGEMNRRNARLALAVAQVLGVDLKRFQQGLASFAGGERRLEFKGEWRGAPLFDDYAHHPTEVAATLAALREKFPQRKLICVYQQHQLGRAQYFFNRLVESLAAADTVVIPNFYRVREERAAESPVRPEVLVAALQERGTPAFFTAGLARTAEWLKKHLTREAVAVIAGAGDVFEVTRKVLGP